MCLSDVCACVCMQVDPPPRQAPLSAVAAVSAARSVCTAPPPSTIHPSPRSSAYGSSRRASSLLQVNSMSSSLPPSSYRTTTRGLSAAVRLSVSQLVCGLLLLPAASLQSLPPPLLTSAASSEALLPALLLPAPLQQAFFSSLKQHGSRPSEEAPSHEPSPALPLHNTREEAQRLSAASFLRPLSSSSSSSLVSIHHPRPPCPRAVVFSLSPLVCACLCQTGRLDGRCQLALLREEDVVVARRRLLLLVGPLSDDEVDDESCTSTFC